MLKLTSPGALGAQLLVLVLFGYPLTSFFQVFVGVSASIPFRLYVVLVAVLILLRPSRSGQRLDWMVAAFFVLYAIRLAYDGLVVGIEGAGDAFIRFTFLVVLPCLAITRAGVIDEFVTAKWAVVTAWMFLFLVQLAYFFGLTYNPWAELEVLSAELQRLRFEGLNPISIGHAAVVGIIVAVAFLAFSRQSRRQSLLLFGLIVMALITLFLANSRGPVAALIVALSIPLMAGGRRTKKVFSLFLLLAVAGVAVYAFTDALDLVLATMYERFFDRPEEDLSNLGRFISQQSAINAGFANPVLGAFYRDPALGINEYPHNLLIESAMALGFIGFGLFVMIHLRAFYAIWSNLRHVRPFFSMIFLQQFIAVCLSGTMWGADAFFVFLSLVLCANRTLDRRPVNDNPAHASRTPAGLEF